MNQHEIHEELENWYQSSLGTQLAHYINHILHIFLKEVYGYVAIHNGIHLITNESLCTERIKETYCVFPKKSGENVIASPASMPFSSDTADLVSLIHSLEMSDRPHQVLREAERILIPNGHLIIVAFNPFSWYNAKKVFLPDTAPFNRQFYQAGRVKDWLTLLNFDIVSKKYVAFRPPVSNKKIYDNLSFLEKSGPKIFPFLGGVYCYLAKKSIAGLTPININRKKSSVVIPGKFAKPTLG
jgi:SAM-dependent methyltransferase